jgi:hypothetical protein
VEWASRAGIVSKRLEDLPRQDLPKEILLAACEKIKKRIIIEKID